MAEVDFWERLLNQKLYLDETETILEVERSQVERFYLPLAEHCLAALTNRSRLLVGVAGPPGCGKSAFSALLAAVINAQAGLGLGCVVGMDGWHYPNAYLNDHFIKREGRCISLRAIKGSPETFDVEAFLYCLTAIRQGRTVRYPVYSRLLHEPVQDGGEVGAAQRVVIVEGNYLFLDEAPWDEICRLFDVRIFIRASLEGIQAGLRERHLRGGKAADVVEKHIQMVDLPNARRVLFASAPASITVNKFDSRLIHSIEWAEGEPLTKC